MKIEYIFPEKYIAGTNIKIEEILYDNGEIGHSFIIEAGIVEEEVLYFYSFNDIKDIPIEYKYPKL